MLKSKDLKFVLMFFAVISFILLFLMVNSFHFIDCCYFVLVVGFAARYYILSRD